SGVAPLGALVADNERGFDVRRRCADAASLQPSHPARRTVSCCAGAAWGSASRGGGRFRGFSRWRATRGGGARDSPVDGRSGTQTGAISTARYRTRSAPARTAPHFCPIFAEDGHPAAQGKCATRAARQPRAARVGLAAV